MKRILFFFLACCLAVISGGHADLVNIKSVQPQIYVDFRYASDYNSLQRPLYPFAEIYVDRFVAHRLGRVMYDLAKDGLGLVIYEGYRPPSVQRTIESLSCDNCQARARDDAPHYRKGLGVDVAIYYLDGQICELPTEYGVICPKTYRDYLYNGPNVYHNSALLEQVMCRYGFVPMREKWWHFDLRGWEEAPDLAIEYEELKAHPAPLSE